PLPSPRVLSILSSAPGCRNVAVDAMATGVWEAVSLSTYVQPLRSTGSVPVLISSKKSVGSEATSLSLTSLASPLLPPGLVSSQALAAPGVGVVGPKSPVPSGHLPYDVAWMFAGQV